MVAVETSMIFYETNQILAVTGMFRFGISLMEKTGGYDWEIDIPKQTLIGEYFEYDHTNDVEIKKSIVYNLDPIETKIKIAYPNEIVSNGFRLARLEIDSRKKQVTIYF